LRRQLIRSAAFAAVLTALALGALPAPQVVDRGSAVVDPDGQLLVRKIKRYQKVTWRWQRLMGVRRTPNLGRYLRKRDREYRRYVMHQWHRRALRAKRRGKNPPHESAWRCIQRYEGSWRDSWDPYWGGLQMDRTFMRQYAPRYLLRRGWANRWTPVEQMWVAERAIRAGRGFYPWPNTARMCGLI